MARVYTMNSKQLQDYNEKGLLNLAVGLVESTKKDYMRAIRKADRKAMREIERDLADGVLALALGEYSVKDVTDAWKLEYCRDVLRWDTWKKLDRWTPELEDTFDSVVLQKLIGEVNETYDKGSNNAWEQSIRSEYEFITD